MEHLANAFRLVHVKKASWCITLIFFILTIRIHVTYARGRKTVRLYIELKVIVQRGAIGGPHLLHAHKLDAACFVSSRIADILHQAQSLLSWMPGELELDTASCIMVHRRTPRLLTQSASWIRCYRLSCVLFDLSNKPWSLSVTLPPRLPDHQRFRISQWNLKIGFYPSFDRCHKGNRLYRASLRADFNSDILIARPPVALITILIPVFIRAWILMTTVTTIDIQWRVLKKVPLRFLQRY